MSLIDALPNNSAENVRANSALADVDTIHVIREMNQSWRVTRRALFAQRLYELVAANGNAYSRKDALAEVARDLGTTESEVAHGIITGIRAGLFDYSHDGQQLIAVP